MEATLYKAINSGDVNVINITSPDVLCTATTLRDNTPLHVAVQFGLMECVVAICYKCPSLLTRTNDTKDTPLHMAARAGLYDIAKFLIQHVGNQSRGDAVVSLIRMTNEEKDTALHEAVRYRCSDIVKLLTEKDPTFQYSANNGGETPLYLAAEDGSFEMVEQILKIFPSSANGGPEGRTALHAAILLDHEDIAKVLFDKQPSSIKVKDDKGWTPLHCAACKGSMKMIKEIIERCPYSWEFLNNSGQNFLHVAACHADPPVIIEILKKYKMVDGLLNERDNDGNTPLHLASISKRYDSVVNLMEDPRVNRRALNKKNQTSSDIVNEVLPHVRKEDEIGGVCSQRQLIMKTETHTLKEYFEMLIKSIKESKDNWMLVATLVLTVTFAAGITVPGGFKSNQPTSGEFKANVAQVHDDGTAVLIDSNPFRVFLFCNFAAMVFSAYSILLHYWANDQISEDARAEFFSWIAFTTFIAILLVIVAFSAASIALVSISTEVILLLLAAGCLVIMFVIPFIVKDRVLRPLRYRTKTSPRLRHIASKFGLLFSVSIVFYLVVVVVVFNAI